MALKGKRIVKETLITKKIDVVAERGKIVAALAADDDFVTVATTIASGTNAIGLLMDDVENRDLTNFPSNQHKNLAQVSGIVSLALEGQFKTDQIPAGVTIANGEPAYLVASGLISNTPDGTKTIEVGKWLSAKDADGFADLNLKL